MQIRNTLLLFIVLLLTACGGAAATAETVAPVASPSPIPSSTPLPTSTPLPPVGVLLASDAADPLLLERMQSFLATAIPQAGLRFQVRPSLTVEAIAQEDIAWVVAIPPQPDLPALVTGAPQTRFLAVGMPEMTPAPNLSVIGSGGLPLDQQGFMAGYTAALITPEWRVGVIGVADDEAAQQARKAFITGVQYYCGLCRPNYPPFFEYPLFFQLNAAASAAEWRAAADFMIHRSVETVYIVPGAGDDDLLRYLAQSGVHLIGGGTPPEDVRGSWVASFAFSSWEAFQQFWPQFAAGEEEQAVPVTLSLEDVNPDLLSPGRQRLVEEVMQDLLAGYIQTISESVP